METRYLLIVAVSIVTTLPFLYGCSKIENTQGSEIKDTVEITEDIPTILIDPVIDRDCYHLDYHLNAGEADNWIYYYDTKTLENADEAERIIANINIFENSDFSFALDSIESDDYRPIVEYHFKETYNDIPIYGTDITLVKLIDGIYVECLTYADSYNNNIKLTKNMFNMQLPDENMDNIVDSNEIKQKFLGEYNLTEDNITFNGLCYKCNKDKNEDVYITILCYNIVNNVDRNNYLIAASTGEVLCCIPSDIN